MSERLSAKSHPPSWIPSWLPYNGNFSKFFINEYTLAPGFTLPSQYDFWVDESSGWDILGPYYNNTFNYPDSTYLDPTYPPPGHRDIGAYLQGSYQPSSPILGGHVLKAVVSPIYQDQTRTAYLEQWDSSTVASAWSEILALSLNPATVEISGKWDLTWGHRASPLDPSPPPGTMTVPSSGYLLKFPDSISLATKTNNAPDSPWIIPIKNYGNNLETSNLVCLVGTCFHGTYSDLLDMHWELVTFSPSSVRSAENRFPFDYETYIYRYCRDSKVINYSILNRVDLITTVAGGYSNSRYSGSELHWRHQVLSGWLTTTDGGGSYINVASGSAAVDGIEDAYGNVVVSIAAGYYGLPIYNPSTDKVGRSVFMYNECRVFSSANNGASFDLVESHFGDVQNFFQPDVYSQTFPDRSAYIDRLYDKTLIIPSNVIGDTGYLTVPLLDKVSTPFFGVTTAFLGYPVVYDLNLQDYRLFDIGRGLVSPSLGLLAQLFYGGQSKLSAKKEQVLFGTREFTQFGTGAQLGTIGLYPWGTSGGPVVGALALTEKSMDKSGWVPV